MEGTLYFLPCNISQKLEVAGFCKDALALGTGAFKALTLDLCWVARGVWKEKGLGAPGGGGDLAGTAEADGEFFACGLGKELGAWGPGRKGKDQTDRA
jgi:hypothetical protein